jgi:enterochelin esterase family protein
MTADDGPLVSPRLEALRAALAGGDGAALERFWAEVAAAGTPLIEPLAGDDAHALVTFLWREGRGRRRPVTGVAVASALGRGDLIAIHHPEPLARLVGTDLWYRTNRAPAALRTSYTLHVDGVPYLAGQPDPLNRHAWSLAGLAGDAAPVAGAELAFTFSMTKSTVALPAAPPQRWCAPRPGAPAGALVCHRVPSAALGEPGRRVWVYTSPGVAAGGGEPALLLFFDGWFYAYPLALPATLDNLRAAGRIPPVVAVLVDNPLPTRGRDLGARPSVFLRFVTDELLPWVRHRYPASTDAARTVVGGFSAGGFAAAALALDHPARFGNVLTQSALVHFGYDGAGEWLAREVARRPRAPLRFALDVGRLETGPPPEPHLPSLLVANRHLRTVLEAKGYEVHYREFAGGHDALCWRGTLADGLLALLGQPAGEGAADPGTAASASPPSGRTPN